MKLGILVVYLVAEEDERLLEIHLSQIEQTTSVPFRIYAAANRLLPRFREKIQRLPYLSICQIPTTTLRDSSEHSYYLDRLVQVAVDDGATCICTFHVDSFPVCAGWVEKITAEMRGNCVLAGAERDERMDSKPVTEFMIFTREFYLAHRPAFLLTENEMASFEYQRYLASCPHLSDSGVGYGFKVWSQGLSWFPLKPVGLDRERHIAGALYGNLIFHLGGTVQQHSARESASSSNAQGVARLLSLFRVLGRAVVPSKLWRRLTRIHAIQRWAFAYWARPLGARAFLETKDALMADPAQFLHRLRDRPQGEAEVSGDPKPAPSLKSRS
jgi:hypothetical protein